MERSACDRGNALEDECLSTIDDPSEFRTVPQCPCTNSLEITFVILAEIGRIGTWDRSVVAHPGYRAARVEFAAKGDSDFLSYWKRRKYGRHNEEERKYGTSLRHKKKLPGGSFSETGHLRARDRRKRLPQRSAAAAQSEQVRRHRQRTCGTSIRGFCSKRKDF
jgi:hypothetical protein